MDSMEDFLKMFLKKLQRQSLEEFPKEIFGWVSGRIYDKISEGIFSDVPESFLWGVPETTIGKDIDFF